MSNPSSLLRDEEELEATLLPVAERIELDDDFVVDDPSHSALPAATFDYDGAIAAEAEQESVAVPLPSLYQNETFKGQDDQRFRLAERAGRQRSDSEQVAIQKANLRGFAKSHYEEQQIRTANELARQRDRQGLQIKREGVEQVAMEQLHAPHSQSSGLEDSSMAEQSQSQSQSPSQSQTDQTRASDYQLGGYKTNDYSTKQYSYDTSDYQVSEYKSVYD